MFRSFKHKKRKVSIVSHRHIHIQFPYRAHWLVKCVTWSKWTQYLGRNYLLAPNHLALPKVKSTLTEVLFTARWRCVCAKRPHETVLPHRFGWITHAIDDGLIHLLYWSRKEELCEYNCTRNNQTSRQSFRVHTTLSQWQYMHEYISFFFL